MTKPVLRSDALYLCDNGACYCGEHAGATARYTGRDISGRRVVKIDRDEVYRAQDLLGAVSFNFRCEQPHCRRLI